MSDHGYIYVTNWDKFQHPDAVRSINGMPWFKTYTDLLGNDDWLELRPVDRVLLMGVWMLTSRYGNGRVNADTRWLCAQLKLDWSGRYRGLERLSQAGFIQVLASKAASRHASKVASTEGEEGSKEPSKKENARANGASSRGSYAARQKQLQNAIAGARALTEGEPDHLVAGIVADAYDEDLVPQILASLTKEKTLG
jgi:hypothetical protein